MRTFVIIFRETKYIYNCIQFDCSLYFSVPVAPRLDRFLTLRLLIQYRHLDRAHYNILLSELLPKN